MAQAILGAAGLASHISSMSRAFVKEREDELPDELPDRPISPHPNYVTEAGLAQIEAELKRAQTALADAQSAEDKHASAIAGRDLRYWTARRASAEVIPPPVDREHVHFGATVTLKRDDGRTQTYRIVGEDEADPAKGTLSHVSPLAKELFGKKIGETASVGGGELEILAIK